MTNECPPRVSIGLPVYNGEAFLKYAVNSILDQTFSDFELLVSDNGSTDSTQEICRHYEALDNRVRYFRYDENRGAAWNFNNVFAMSRGEYFQWAAHDDVYDVCFLEEAVQVLDKNPQVVLCFAGTDFIDEEGNVTRSYEFPIDVNGASTRELFFVYAKGGYVIHEIFGLIRSSQLRRSPLIGRYAGSDKVLLGYLALRGTFHQISRTLFFHREHPGRSIKAAAGAENFTQWFDPSKSGRYAMPFVRRTVENAKTVVKAQIGVREKVQCLLEIGRALSWNRNRMWREIASLAKRSVLKP